MKYANNVEKDISRETSAALAQRIIQFKGIHTPDWVKGYIGEKTTVANCTFGEAWGELLKRENEKKISPVRNALEQAAKGNMIRVKADASVVVVNKENKSMAMAPVLGFWTKKLPNEENMAQLNTIAVIESLKDVVSVAITKSVDSKNYAEVVQPEVADILKCPVYPVSAKFYNTQEQRVSTRKEIFRDIDKVMYSQPNEVIQYLTNVKTLTFDKFVFSVNMRVPKLSNWPQAYRYLVDSRKYRGKDSGEQAQASVGYYYGSMTDMMYRTAYVVSDLTRLSMKYGRKCLEIGSVNNLITLTVIHSLVSAGWTVRCIHDFSRPVSDSLTVGYFQRVPFPDIYLSYVDSQDKFPYVNNCYVPTPAYQNFLNRPDIKGSIEFTYLFAQKALFEQERLTLIPSAHAHAGSIIVLRDQDSSREVVKEEEYLQRFVMANACKNVFPFTRERFILKDPFAFKEAFAFVLAKVFSTIDDKSYDFEVFKQDPIGEMRLAKTLEDYKKEIEKKFMAEEKDKEKPTSLADHFAAREGDIARTAEAIKEKAQSTLPSSSPAAIDPDALNGSSNYFEDDS